MVVKSIYVYILKLDHLSSKPDFCFIVTVGGFGQVTSPLCSDCIQFNIKKWLLCFSIDQHH